MNRFTDGYLLYLLAQASDRVSSEFHTLLADKGVAVSTWRILASLYPDIPATINELTKSCLTKQPTMTRQIDRLALNGLVTREAGTNDKRRVTVSLTDEGRELAQSLIGFAQSHEEALLEHYKETDIANLKTVLQNLLKHRA